MEVVLFYADWCPHCHELLKHKKELKDIIKNYGFQFKKVENSETDKVNEYKKKYKFDAPYFPILMFFGGDEPKELSVEFNELKKQLKKIKEKKEDFNNTLDVEDYEEIKEKKQDKKNKLIIIYGDDYELQNINSICQKFKKLSDKNNTDCTIINIELVKQIKGIDENQIKTPLFIFLNITTNQTNIYKYNKQDLKQLYSKIVDNNNYFNIDYIPKFLSNLFKSKDNNKIGQSQIYNYDFQQQVNPSTLLKCKFSYDQNGNKISDCQTIY